MPKYKPGTTKRGVELRASKDPPLTHQCKIGSFFGRKTESGFSIRTMREAQWARIEDIFNRAAVMPPAEQEIFVSEACRDDEQLCRQITSLLDEDQRIDGLLDEPLASFGLRLIGDPTFDVVPGTFFGRYRVISLLGQGGMGSVFLAEDVELKRNVALKFIPQL